ncbi:carboxylesterase/lipase family protein [Ktedonosporobacter rubrisoli]|uniref:Carboxylesterase/lipase family protein n=1 Tax=Ktedonosporobacter rubrisoli TaxID=2509675 RepID=A0A4V0YZK4_KTERU|nr:carboxylesterase family protein [Ktedonosporobacter rubrisoli]QBD80031.1 carboxylesterase/lipase family protein [Ktedonosporobacter rubrisoli]
MVARKQSKDFSALVQTDAGPILGTVYEEYRLFQGIPYAAPPVGELRWKSPQPPEPWSEPRNATKPGNWCPQPQSGLANTPGGGTEDCLFLNVTTPHAASVGQLKPVMVWLHGGGPVGAGSPFDAHRLALIGDVVVVTLNYRLGIFGFFGYPGLQGAGGFGLEDQQAALRWVQRNIAAFGGDPQNVTLFGQSYGGLCTTMQLSSPTAVGLFQRAIIQSDPAAANFPRNAFTEGAPALPSLWRSRAEVEALGQYIVESEGWLDPAKTDPTTALKILRSLPATSLIPATAAFSCPVFGNAVQPENPAQALRSGHFQQMTVMAGGTRDEARYFVGVGYDFQGRPLQSITAERYAALLTESFGEAAPEIRERYPLSDYESPGLAWASVISDGVWALGNWQQNRALAEQVPLYVYEFADRQAPHIASFLPDVPPGAYHAAELNYLLDFFDQPAQLAPEQQRLSEQMIRYWTNFARTGNPNSSDLPAWPFFDPGKAVPYVQALTTAKAGGIRGIDLAAEHQLDFWSDLRAG